MSWRGRLIIDGGISSLANPQPPTVPDPVRLAIDGGSPTPFVAATNILVNNGFVNNEPVIVAGQSGEVGNVAVIFMTGVQHAAEVEGALARAGVSGVGKKRTKKRGGAEKAMNASARGAGAKTKRKTSAKSAAKYSAKRGAKKTAKPTSKKAAKRPANKRGSKNQ